MAVVVEQTIPFSSSTLDLQNDKRWTNLFPLIRPNVQAVKTAKGQRILVNETAVKSKFVHIAAVGKQGNFSSKLLDERNIAAVVTEHAGAGVLTAEDIYNSLRSTGIADHQGIVVVRIGKTRTVEALGPDVVEVTVEQEMDLDHILHLLSNATDSCRASIHQILELLKLFAKGVATAHSKFHVEKAAGNPAVVHASGASGFTHARHAVERDLKHVMKSQSSQRDDTTYSVHYSDVNGLSRLENYIIAGEIAQILGEVIR
jgi:hypothetical protein